MFENNRYLDSIAKKPLDRTPVWFMRQAGRYLPEYRESRKKAGDFMSLCRNAQLACEVTMQPIDRYGLDTAILFSDILTIPDALGLGLSFKENHGPVFAHPITTVKQIDGLPLLDPNDELGYVMNAVSTIRSALGNSIPLIGFSGSPWTLATYMIEGQGSKTYSNTKKMIYNEPAAFSRLIDILTENVIVYLSAQVEAGANALMIFDSWGGALTTPAYERYSLAAMSKICDALKIKHPNTPITLFTKNGSQWLELIAQCACDMVSIDWSVNLKDVRARIGDKVALQGNLDPGVLYGSEAIIREQVRLVLDSYGKGSGHVFNLGHGIEQFISPDHVAIMIDEVRSYSPSLHR